MLAIPPALLISAQLTLGLAPTGGTEVRLVVPRTAHPGMAR